MIRLSKQLQLPADFVSQTAAILGIRGGGKSNAAALLVEGLYDAKLPFCIIDPEGSWYGLRAGNNALDIPIFGGDHGDVPLEPGSGKLVARLIAEQRLSCVVDTSELSETAKRALLADFGEELYRRNREPLHLVLEEADDYLPQRVDGPRARTLRAWETIVRRGRKRGLGCTMITQRSASINKDVLTQVDTLFVLRTTAPQDLKAIKGWLEYQGQAKDVLSTLPKLKAGECWVWSPSYLDMLKRFQLPRRRTFDSAATPKHKRGKRAPATLSSIDLGDIREQMASTIERAKAEDPRELRKRIAELERQLAERPAAAPERVEVPVLGNTELQQLREQHERLEITVREFGAAIRAVDAGRTPQRHSSPVPTLHAPRLERGPPQRDRGAHNGRSDLPPAKQRLLDALAWLKVVNINAPHRNQLAFIAGVSSTSGAYANNLSAMRTAGLIDYPGNGAVSLTEQGARQAAVPASPPTNEDLHGMIFSKLPPAKVLILKTLLETHPHVLTREDLASSMTSSRGEQVSATSGAFANNLSALKTLGFIDYPERGSVGLTEHMFL